MTRVQVSVDAGLCMSSGTCVDIAPRLFTIGADKKSRPTDDASLDSPELEDAVDCCPVRAITVTRLEHTAD
ncbi:ferredoxin [Mycobacterium syngnathidarum]